MSKTRRNHAPQFKAKAKVALEALAGEKTIHEIAAKHQIHPNQVTQWRRQLIDQAAEASHNCVQGSFLPLPIARTCARVPRSGLSRVARRFLIGADPLGLPLGWNG
jgi:transposase